MNAAKRWLTTKDLAAEIGLRSADGARRWALANRLTPIWRGHGWLYDRVDLDRLLERLKGRHSSTVVARVA